MQKHPQNEILLFQLLEKVRQNSRKEIQHKLDELAVPITPDHWLILEALQKNGKMNQASLCGLLNKDKGALSRIIDGIFQKGLVLRVPDKTDGRKSLVKLTPKGEEIIGLCKGLRASVRKNELDKLTSGEKQQFFDLLEKLL